MTTVIPAARSHSERVTPRPVTRLDFFGLSIDVSGRELPDFAFHFGPHVHSSRSLLPPTFCAELAPLGPSRTRCGPTLRELSVRRPDGVTLLRRPVRGWSNIPPPIPPFAVLTDRVAITPAVVLARGSQILALVGSPGSAKPAIAMAMARRDWRFVSGQLLVVDRRTGQALPFLTPLEIREPPTLRDQVRRLPDTSCRSITSAVTGQVLLVRPESVGPVVGIDDRLGLPTVVRLCRSTDERIRLRAAEVAPPFWPADAGPARTAHPGQLLEVPDGEYADEAAQHVDDWFTRRVHRSDTGRSESCLDTRVTPRESRAGSTTSRQT